MIMLVIHTFTLLIWIQKTKGVNETGGKNQLVVAAVKKLHYQGKRKLMNNIFFYFFLFTGATNDERDSIVNNSFRYTFFVGILFSMILGPYSGVQLVAGTQETDYYVSNQKGLKETKSPNIWKFHSLLPSFLGLN